MPAPVSAYRPPVEPVHNLTHNPVECDELRGLELRSACLCGLGRARRQVSTRV